MHSRRSFAQSPTCSIEHGNCATLIPKQVDLVRPRIDPNKIRRPRLDASRSICRPINHRNLIAVGTRHVNLASHPICSNGIRMVRSRQSRNHLVRLPIKHTHRTIVPISNIGHAIRSVHRNGDRPRPHLHMNRRACRIIAYIDRTAPRIDGIGLPVRWIESNSMRID